MDTREQPAPGVTAQDIERWLDANRERLRRLEARRLPDAPDELLDAEIAMVQATIGQLQAELHFLAVERRQQVGKRADLVGTHEIFRARGVQGGAYQLADDAEPYRADSSDAIAVRIRPDGTVILPDGRVEALRPRR